MNYRAKEAGDELKKLVQFHAAQIGEHVDAVQIFVTLNLDEGKETRSYEYGSGNFHARLGQIQEWLTIQEEYSREWARQQQKKEDEP